MYTFRSVSVDWLFCLFGWCFSSYSQAQLIRIEKSMHGVFTASMAFTHWSTNAVLVWNCTYKQYISDFNRPGMWLRALVRCTVIRWKQLARVHPLVEAEPGEILFLLFSESMLTRADSSVPVSLSCAQCPLKLLCPLKIPCLLFDKRRPINHFFFFLSSRDPTRLS